MLGDLELWDLLFAGVACGVWCDVGGASAGMYVLSSSFGHVQALKTFDDLVRVDLDMSIEYVVMRDSLGGLHGVRETLWDIDGVLGLGGICNQRIEACQWLKQKQTRKRSIVQSAVSLHFMVYGNSSFCYDDTSRSQIKPVIMGCPHFVPGTGPEGPEFMGSSEFISPNSVVRAGGM